MNRIAPALGRQSGFSLVELMIALVLGLMVIGGATAVFLSNKQSYRSNNALSQVQEGSRIAFELISRDLRGAGLTGCGNVGRVGNVLNNGPNRDSDADGDPTNDPDDVWWSDFGNAVRGYEDDEADPAITTGTAPADRVAGTDSLQLIGITGTGWSLLSHNTGTTTIAPNEIPNLAAGDIIIVCDPENAAIAQITTFNTAANNFTVANAGTVTPGNCTSGLRLPTACGSATGNFIPQFGGNSLISRMTAVDWYIGNNAQGGRSLYQVALRNNAGAAGTVAQEMIRNVTDLQLQYLQAGTDYVAAGAVTNWTNVRAVRMTITLQGNELFAGTDAQPISRQFTASVALRNRVN